MLWIDRFWFSWVVRICPEIGKNRKEIIWLLMATLGIIRVYRASRIFDFNDFLSKDLAWSSASGNPLDSFHPLGVALKNCLRYKMMTFQNTSSEAQVNNSFLWKCYFPFSKYYQVFTFLTISWFTKSVTSWWVLVHETGRIFFNISFQPQLIKSRNLTNWYN